MIQAEGPQSFADGEGFDEEEDMDGAMEGEDSQYDEIPLWEESEGELYEYVMTLERGGLSEAADTPSLFKYGLPSFRADLLAMKEFSYKSDWPLARPLHLVVAHYDGRVSRDAMRTWEKETTKELLVHELLCDARSMLREDTVVEEFGEWLNDKVREEMDRVKDPDEEQLDEVARGVR